MTTKRVPLRTCLACGARRPQRALVRLVCASPDSVEMDLGGRRPGRGAYLCQQAECWERGASKKALDRAFRASVTPTALQGLRAQYEQWRQDATGNEAS